MLGYDFLTPGSLADRFFAPLLDLLPGARHTRACPSLSDRAWLLTGLARVLDDQKSGRAFLQKFAALTEFCPGRSHFFESLKSTRRLSLCAQLNESLLDAGARTLSDPFAAFPKLGGFDLWAGDGHFHTAAVHDARDKSGTRWPVGHVFMLNLRTHLIRHLDAGDQALRRKENELRLLKRSSWDNLRAGAPAGRRVIHIYDRACVDFTFWHKAKHEHGLYFISRPKDNLSLQRGGELPWDRDDSVNAGVLSDEQVAPATHGRHVRLVTWRNPENGQAWQFLTSEHTLPPGLIVLLYLKRWDIEKVFDETKNKLEERRARAGSANAKCMQAQFICLAHNLMVLEEDRLRREHAITNTAEEKRRAGRLRNVEEKAGRENRAVPSGQKAVQRLTQRSVKFIRWLRTFLWHEATWDRMLAVLRRLYATM